MDVFGSSAPDPWDECLLNLQSKRGSRPRRTLHRGHSVCWLGTLDKDLVRGICQSKLKEELN